MSFGNVLQQTSSAASNAQSYLNNNVNSFVSPKNAKGLCGWIFDIEKETSVKLESDVTDNYTESGSYINDHIVNKPIQITLSGFIGELVYVRPNSKSIIGLQRTLQNELTTISAYLGKYSPQAIQQIQKIQNKSDYIQSRINQELSRVQNIVSFFQGESFQETKQKKAYRQLYAFWLKPDMNGDKLLTVQTPFEFYDHMVITSLSFTQTEESELYSDISITLKQMRFGSILTKTFDNDTNPVRIDLQKSDTVNNSNGSINNNSLGWNINKTTGFSKLFGF